MNATPRRVWKCLVRYSARLFIDSESVTPLRTWTPPATCLLSGFYNMIIACGSRTLQYSVNRQPHPKAGAMIPSSGADRRMSPKKDLSCIPMWLRRCTSKQRYLLVFTRLL